MSEDTEINMDDDMMKEIEQVRKSLKLPKDDIKEIVNMLQEARNIMVACGDENQPIQNVALLAFALELNKIRLTPIPDVEPIGEPSGHVVWPDGLDT